MHWISRLATWRTATRTCSCLWLLAGLVSGPAGAARLAPPSESITAPQNTVVVAEVVHTREASAVLRVHEALHGEASGDVEVRLTLGAEELHEKGANLVVAYSDLAREPRHGKGWVRDPNGPIVVVVPAVGAAVLEDSASMRLLGSSRKEGAPLNDEDILAAILDQLPRPHVQSRRFVLAELVLRPNLLDLLDGAGRGRLRETLESGQLEPMARDYLLQALLPIAGQEQIRPWLAQECRATVAASEPRLDLMSSNPAMLKTAIKVLAGIGAPGDVPELGKHLSSNNPAVARQAWKAILSLDPKAAGKQAGLALERGDLGRDVRIALERYIRELDQAAGQDHKEP